jgi:hypothetical protein
MLKNLGLLAIAVGAGLVLAEIGLRIAGVSYPAFYMEDRYVGDRLRPGAQGTWPREQRENPDPVFIRINSEGMHDVEHTVAKPPNTLRIAVLGDSFAEAMSVPLRDAFWSVLERRLDSCPSFGSRHVEALNFGVSGYGTAQELLMLRHYVWQYRPDIVLLAFFSGNDVRNNSEELNNDPAVPYFLYKGGQLVLDNSFRDRLRSLKLGPVQLEAANFLAGVRNHSRLVQLLSEARTAFGRRAALKKAEEAKDDMAGQESAAATGGEIGLDSEVYAPPKNATWAEAWRVTEGLIGQMRDEVEAHGAQFWVVTLSTGIQVYPDPATREVFMKRLGVDNLFYPDQRIAGLCEREHINVITLAPAMQQYAGQHHIYLHGFAGKSLGFGHWNVAGNHLAGELIAEKLCAQKPGTVHSFPDFAGQR